MAREAEASSHPSATTDREISFCVSKVRHAAVRLSVKPGRLEVGGPGAWGEDRMPAGHVSYVLAARPFCSAVALFPDDDRSRPHIEVCPIPRVMLKTAH